MPTLTRQRRLQLVKKEEGTQLWSWMVLIFLGIVLFCPLLVAEGAFYDNANFPYSQNSALSNLSANQAFTLVSNGLKGPGGTSPLLPTGGSLNFVVTLTNFALGFYFVVAVGIIIYHGILVMLSRGSDEKRKAAVKVIINIFIATAVVMFSYIIVRFVVEFFRDPSSVVK